jgi:hypothetical protein
MEESIGAPTGTPQQIMSVVLQETADPAEPRDVKTIMPLSKKLWEIAKHHGQGPIHGDESMPTAQIPLNGRLFQQWLHYVKPQHCPYPHKRGSVELLNLAGCGSDCAHTDMEAAAKDATHTVPEGLSLEEGADADAWMSQWELDEELLIGTQIQYTNKLLVARFLLTEWAPAAFVSIGFLISLFYVHKVASAWGLCSELPKFVSGDCEMKRSSQSICWQALYSTKSHLV